MTAPRRAVIVMAKQPSPGSTKTRLQPALDPVAAAALYECFLHDAIDLAGGVPGATPLIAIHPPSSNDYFERIAPGVGLVAQLGDRLGDRLDHVLSFCLAEGFDHVVAINSDSPTLPTAYVVDAFDRLGDPATDVALGPADDGGYYLIGVKAPPGPIVTDVEMSTPHVLDDTIVIATTHGLVVELLAPWYDVDSPAELERLRTELVGDTTPADGGRERYEGAHTRAFLEDAARSDGSSRTDQAIAPPAEHVTVAVVIPALDEAGNIGTVVKAASAEGVGWVIVADNGSTDDTADEAEQAGAIVVAEPRRGYGYACAAGSEEAIRRGATVIVYLDGDRSSRPEEIGGLVAPIEADEADLVLGSRVLGHIDQGAMAPHQRFGNWMSARLMRRLYRIEVTDLGPYRAITSSLLAKLSMQEMTFGWPTEMTVKSANAGATIVEVPVSWLRRGAGRSKVSGTIRGSLLAARHILGVTIRYSRRRAGAEGAQTPASSS